MNVTPEMLKKCTDGMANTGIFPSEDEINSVCDITGVDRARAIVLLKKWPGWQDAVTHYFDNPSSAVREEASARQWEPQDNIPYADNMSRPPSPSSNFVDLSDMHAEATVNTQEKQQQQEDDELKQAMAESIKGMSGQENGTTNSGQQFGPAQRAYYDPAQWAVAPIASSREIVDHPPPTKRRRRPGEPAFLRGSSDTKYNAPLLTIYHSIPLAREALLFPPLEVLSYGHSSEWWSGATDENSKSLSMQDSSPGDEDRRKYLTEIQCLMAFLDSTTRAYGSVDALSELRYYKYVRADQGHTRFIQAWQAAAMDEKEDEPLTQIFTSVASRGPIDSGATAETKETFFVEGATRESKTQSELLDQIIWSAAANQPLETTWIEKFGHIITMRIWNDSPGATRLDMVPTEVWYVDRYTPELRETLYAMRLQCQSLQREKERLSRAQLQLTEMPRRPNAPRTTIRKALEAARNAMPFAVDDSMRSDERLVDVETKSDSNLLQQQIDRLLSEIEDRSQALNNRRLELDAQIISIMSDILDPVNSSQHLRHKYVLQGVSTKANIMYLRKLNHDLIDMEDDEQPHGMWQWWRMAWGEIPHASPEVSEFQQGNETEDTTPFSVRKVSANEVLDAVANEHSTAVLVYADDTAMNFRASSPSLSLKQFVEQDNRAFEDEASLLHIQQPNRGRSWSNETNSTVMDDGTDTNPFGDNTYPTHPLDMTSMSTSTVTSLDGQPSPKRPRSSDESKHETMSMEMPPSYDDIADHPPQEMTEKKGNKIGQFAEQLLQHVDKQQQQQA